jgi:hypothetical protein
MNISIISTCILTFFTTLLFQKNPEKDLTYVKNVRHQIIYHKQNRFAGWPANNGAYIFDNNEIVVGFTEGPYELSDGHNTTTPYTTMLAKSLDGGETWTVYDPENFVGDFGEKPNLKSLQEPIDFKKAGFAMRIVGEAYHGANDERAHFFYSYDAGKTWKGPFGFGDLLNDPQIKKSGLNELTPRTDYVVTGKNECLVIISAREKDSFATDRLFCIKTIDGGKTFSFQGWIVKPQSLSAHESDFKINLYSDEEKNPYASECRAVMSQTLKIGSGELVSVIRRKYIHRGGPDKHWIDAYSSSDNGRTWKFLAKIADTGSANGNPPAMTITKDGRLCVVYGERDNGTIRIVYSSDQGKTWSEPQILMDGFWSEDMELNDLGYPRIVCRNDGKLVAMYYYSTKEHLHHLRATIWEP